MWGKKKNSIYEKLLDAVKEKDELADYKAVEALAEEYISERKVDKRTVLCGLISMFRGKGNRGGYLTVTSLEMTLWMGGITIIVNVSSNMSMFYATLVLLVVLILMKADKAIKKTEYKINFVLSVLEHKLGSLSSAIEYIVHVEKKER